MMASASASSFIRWGLTGIVATCCVAGMGSARAASYYRDTVCVGTESRELEGDAIDKIDVLVERAAAYPSGVAGMFVTVFLGGESLADLRRGLAAASALTKNLEDRKHARTWPADLKFLVHHEQPCSSARVLVEVSVVLNERPLADPKR